MPLRFSERLGMLLSSLALLGASLFYKMSILLCACLFLYLVVFRVLWGDRRLSSQGPLHVSERSGMLLPSLALLSASSFF